MYTAREGIYRKVLEEGAPLPDGLAAASNANFHCSPAAARGPDGTFNVGGVTATASFRFSKWMPRWFEASGAKVVIGKGGMSGADYREHFVPAGAVYLTTVGYGTGALLGRGIKRVRGVHWLDELGIAQAMWVFEVERFGPFLVGQRPCRQQPCSRNRAGSSTKTSTASTPDSGPRRSAATARRTIGERS